MGDLDGLAIVRLVKEHGDTLVMVISGSSDVKKAVEALQEGASHYILKPVNKDELLAVVNKSADELRRLRTIRELRRQLDERFGFEGLIGNSPRMRELIERLKAFAPTRATVLILGENGTGKELVAKAHAHQQPAEEQAVRGHELRRPEREPARRRDVRARGRGVHRGRQAAQGASSSTPTAGRCSSTRSATCRRPSRPSCSGCWRTARSPGSGRTRRSRWTSAWSRRPTATWSR